VDILGERHRNIFVVGDDSQSIYSFRGATFENILDFQKRFPDAQVYRLETNYRSTPEILELANQSIARNRRRLPKKLTSVRRQGLRPAFVACCDHYVQSRFIAQYILHLVEQGRSFNDIAVLYRSHWHSLDIQLELQRRNVPFQVRGGLRFFEQAHIKDVVAYLRILQNPRDQLAWMRILPHMPRVGAKTAQRVWQYISAACEPLLAAIQPEAAALLPRSVRPFYQRFCDLLQTLGSLQAPAEIMQAVIDDYYGEYLESHYEQARLRREDLNGIMTFAEQYKTLDAFLADVALSGEYSGENVAAGPLEREFVVLSTVHQAKGLEWPVVIIPWLADGRFPADLAMNADDEIEEERRVFHVAVTRAEDELYLVVPRTMQGRGQGRTVMKPSRFLTELGAGVMERLQLDEDIPDPRGSTFRAGGGRGGNPAHDCEPESHPDDLHYEYDDTPF
jgi:DNA helicase-2/ATP-dependent DNA helicase PcrA